ncbi:MAG TPA: AraC family transcriptional regulator [Pedobacter sp.]|uniref:AraC family transcriptional regulator n=1 Tax=Pedobacter sp. TaxID=1411316 RepID=UPI002BBB0D90|nr:AraC family transcriptional regulator [Pedobacter sp.]HMI01195.1 AraC family transcriptional regulator [Pedobacter sp.]
MQTSFYYDNSKAGVSIKSRLDGTADPRLLDVELLLTDSIYVKELIVSSIEDQFHFHNTHEIALILKSKGTRIIGDSIENFSEGDLVILGPKVPHISYYNNSAIHALVVYFRPNWLTENQLNSESLFKLRKLFNDTDRGIKVTGLTKQKVAKNLFKLKRTKGLERILILLNILEAIAKSNEYQCLASEGYSNSFSQQDIKRLDRVYQYIRDHFTETITLENIASISNMAPTAFCKYFKNKTQKTFTNFVNEVRIGYSCKLLWNLDLSVSDICFKCGFNNLTNFNRNFKLYTKMSPSKYRMSIGHKKL